MEQVAERAARKDSEAGGSGQTPNARVAVPENAAASSRREDNISTARVLSALIVPDLAMGTKADVAVPARSVTMQSANWLEVPGAAGPTADSRAGAQRRSISTGAGTGGMTAGAGRGASAVGRAP